LTKITKTIEPRAATDASGGRRASTREGLLAGVVAATGVGICLIIIDLAAGQPFGTPGAWWNAVISLFAMGTWAETPVVALIGYTAMHYGVFVALGVTAAEFLELGREYSGARFVILLAFMLAQLMFFGLVAVSYDLSIASDTTCVQLLMGSVLGSALIGVTLLRDSIFLPSVTTLEWLHPSRARAFPEQLPTRSEY
jgi:hypothetical protein